MLKIGMPARAHDMQQHTHQYQPTQDPAFASGDLQIEPMSPNVGAQINGIDIGAQLDQTVIEQLTRALGHYGVLFFRNQKLDPQQHLAFARRFGPINVNRFFNTVDGHPSVAEVRKEPDQKKNIGSIWHTDHSYDESPAMGSVLRAIEVPPCGGDTLFASLGAAYDSLSPTMQRMLRSLKAWHSSRHVFGKAASRIETRQDGRIGNATAATQDACHPMVIAHPVSGRPTLYVNPQFTVGIDGWSAQESDSLLQSLWRHVTQPEHICRFRWETNTVAFWDNRATWHMALNDYHGHRRLMHRVTVGGCTLTASASS